MDAALNFFPVVLYTYSYDLRAGGQFTYISDASRDILGLEPDQILKNPTLLTQGFDPFEWGEFDQLSRKAWDRQENLNWRGKFKAGGQSKILEIRSKPVADPSGSILRYGTIQDVSSYISEAEASQVRYQELVDKLPVGVAIHRLGKLVYVNAMACQILGATPEALVGTHVLNYVHPDNRESMLTALREVEGSATDLHEQKYLTIDGREIFVESTAFPYSYQGSPSIQVIFRDVTERKNAERRLNKSNTLFANLFHNVPIAVVLLDQFGKVEMINNGFESMFGFGLHELKGQNLNDFIVPEELSYEGVDLNNIISAKNVVSIETRRKKRDGTLLNVILYGVPVSQNGETISIYGVYVDITDRKKVEDELKVRNTELDNFVYKVSHDLRAPLSSVLGLVNLAKLPGNTDNPMDYIDLIGAKVTQLDNFIGDVLSHSKNLKMDVTLSPVDLQRIAHTTFQDHKYLPGSDDMTLEVDYNGGELVSDRWRLAEIFRNLISNSIKYRRQDGVKPWIKVKITVDERAARIEFSDNGIGIEAGSVDKIFDMFYRATEQSDGSGIGLYIVKNAVEKLGGQIKVESVPFEGTRFTLLLPNRNSGSIVQRKILQDT